MNKYSHGKRSRKSRIKKKVSGTNPLFKPKVFLQSPQIQWPTLPFQNIQIPCTKRVSTLHMWKKPNSTITKS